MPGRTAIGDRPVGLLPELRAAARQAEALVHSGASRLARPLTWDRREGAVVAMWSTGTVGDAWTTLAMMATGRFEEGNSVAALGMAAVGPVVYTVWASLVCVGLMTANLGRPAGRYAVVIVGALVVLGALKVATAAGNALLWSLG